MLARPSSLLHAAQRIANGVKKVSAATSMSSTPGSGRSLAGSSVDNCNNRSGGGTESNMLSFVDLVERGISPRDLLSQLTSIPVRPGVDDVTLWKILLSMMIEPPKRKKLPQYNTIEDAIALIKRSNKIVVLSGAGISTSAGLPDFRSRNGIYVQIHDEHPDLRDPKSMFDIDYFRKNPLPFYQFAKALYPGQFKPTIGHQFIKCIEEHGKLLRNYTQNIDTLEKQAGIDRVIECHGSFAKATCTNCGYQVSGDDIRDDVFQQRVPKCPKCHSTDQAPADSLGVLKPNIVFFGEQLGNEFHSALEEDKEEVDLLIVIGSSLKVRPVALIPRSIPADVPQILINREPLEHMGFDIELLGDCDQIIQELCLRLDGDWKKICNPNMIPLTQLEGQEAAEALLSSEDSAEQTSTCTTTNMLTDDLHASETTIIIPQDESFMNTSRSTKQSDTTVIYDDAGSDRANVGSESTERNMIEELETQDCSSDEKQEEMCATDERETSNSDDDWEDIEVLDDDLSGEGSPDSSGHQEKIDIQVPESAFLFIKPNKYFFKGAELTKVQLETHVKDQAN